MTTLAEGRVRVTEGRLADGRPIRYYDDSEPFLSGPAGRDTPDTRPLESRPPASVWGENLRQDVLTGDWVTVASHRNTRTYKPPADECPLCPTGRNRFPSEIPASDYDVVVFENRFPSLSGEGTGQCEVVCFTSDHDASFASLSPRRARTVIEAWADRTERLSATKGVQQVFPFENRGEEIGVTLHHPHGQLYAFPFLTPFTEALLRQARAHRDETGRSLLRDVLEAEVREGTRVVLSGEHWTAYVPYAARWPVEVHLAPHRDVPDLAGLDEAERSELAVVYLELLRRADRYFEGVKLPYISGWHQAPVHEGRELGRLHLRLFSVLRAPGKLKYLAGVESGMGAWVNDAVPERIAARLREVATPDA